MDTKTLAAVHDFLATQKVAMVDLLRSLVSIESPSTDPESQSRMFALLQRQFESLDFRVRHVAGRSSGGQIIAIPKTRTRNRPLQLLLGHCDTVWPIGTLDSMPIHVQNGCFFGPGSYDMKAGIVQGLMALSAIQKLNLQPTVDPLWMINSDEEIGSRDSHQLIIRLARSVCRALVLEPSLGPAGNLKTARKGVGRFKITINGRAAHAGLDPDRGISANVELSHVIQQLDAMNDAVAGTSVNVGIVNGGIRANVIAPQSSAEIDVRVLTSTDAAEIEKAIKGIQPTTSGASLSVSGSIDRPPLEKTDRNQRLWDRAKMIAEHMGIELSQATAGGGSDGNFTSQYTATLDGLGAVGAGAHASNEHVVIERMTERATLLVGLLMQDADATGSAAR